MFEEVKEAWGGFIQRFHDQLMPTTKIMHEFCRRDFSEAYVLAPERMIDKIEEMLASYTLNQPVNVPHTPDKIPVVITCFGRDYITTGRDYTIEVRDKTPIIIPTDTKDRFFEIRTVAGDIRVQLAIITLDPATAKSIAAQFLLFIDSPVNRGFDAKYIFAQQNVYFPCQIEMTDSPASNIDTGSKNLTVLAIDINLHCTIPLYNAPTQDQPNDGKGTGPSDPSGYPLVNEIKLDDSSDYQN